MTGRFRFTPVCCCGGGGGSDDKNCIEPCVPECSEVIAGLWVNELSDYITLNHTDPTDQDYYLPDCGDKTPFTVYYTPDAQDGDPYHAYIAQSLSAGHTHIIRRVRYSLQTTTAKSVFATQQAVYCESPVSVPIDSRLINCGVFVESRIAPSAPAINLYTYQYDYPFWHNPPHYDYDVQDYVIDNIESVRIFCTPFDLSAEAEPFKFCDGATTVGLSALSFQSMEDCGFALATECNADHNLKYEHKGVTNASDFLSNLNGLTFSNNCLDFYVVRLFGFGSPTCVTPKGSVDDTEDFLFADVAGISVQFIITSLLNKNSNAHDIVIDDEICVKDFPADGAVVDWANAQLPPGLDIFNNYIHRSNRGRVGPWNERAYYYVRINSTMPPYYYVSDYWYAYVLTPFENRQHIPCSYKFGRIADMPTTWRSPLKPVAAADDVNEKRFHGIYWCLSSISPCGGAFPQDVTHGNLWSVPVGYLTISGNPTVIPEWIEGQPLARFNAQLSKSLMSQSFTDTDWNKTWSDYPSYGGSLKYAIVNNIPEETVNSPWYVHWGGSSPVNCYIPKPEGKHLVRLLWRVFKKDNYYPLNDSSTGYVVNNHGTITTDGDTASYGTNMYFGPFDATDLDIYEQSVNGEGFATFTNTDTGETCYVPGFTGNHFREYFGATEVKFYTLLAAAFSLASANDVKMYPRLDFTYIAVWGDDN